MRGAQSLLPGSAGDADTESKARGRVNAAKIALGERGPVWWDDEAPDCTRHRVEHTPYTKR